MQQAGWNGKELLSDVQHGKGKNRSLCVLKLCPISLRRATVLVKIDRFIITETQRIATWVPSIGDLMAEDWQMFMTGKMKCKAICLNNETG